MRILENGRILCGALQTLMTTLNLLISGVSGVSSICFSVNKFYKIYSFVARLPNPELLPETYETTTVSTLTSDLNSSVAFDGDCLQGVAYFTDKLSKNEEMKSVILYCFYALTDCFVASVFSFKLSRFLDGIMNQVVTRKRMKGPLYLNWWIALTFALTLALFYHVILLLTSSTEVDPVTSGFLIALLFWKPVFFLHVLVINLHCFQGNDNRTTGDAKRKHKKSKMESTRSRTVHSPSLEEEERRITKSFVEQELKGPSQSSA